MSLFGKKGCGYEGAEMIDPETGFDKCANDFDKANFSSFFLSMGLLYRVGTGTNISNFLFFKLLLEKKTIWLLPENLVKIQL